MKMNRKLRNALVLMCSAILLVCLSVGATLAYLTSTTGVVKNTFTVGNVLIDLWETDFDKDTNTADNETINGKAVDKANAYKLLPGLTYEKDPFVVVKANSEESYVFMAVAATNLANLKKVFPEDVAADDTFLLQNFVDWNTDWEYVSATEDVADDTCIYLFRYNATIDTLDPVADAVMPALFTTITMPNDIINNQVEMLSGTQINVKAFAIQADGITKETATEEATKVLFSAVW